MDVYQPYVAIPRANDAHHDQKIPPLSQCFPQHGPLHSWMWYASQCTGLPPVDFFLGAGLVLLAYEASMAGTIFAPDDRPRLQVGFIAGSTAGKSTVIRLASSFHRAYTRTRLGPQSFHFDAFLHLEGSVPGIVEELACRYNAQLDRTPAILFHEEFSRVLQSQDAVAEVLNSLFDNLDDYTKTTREYRQMERQQGQQQQDNLPGVPNIIQRPAISALLASTPIAMEKHIKADQLRGGLFSRIIWFTGSAGELTLERPPTTGPHLQQVLHVWTQWGHWVAETASLGKVILRISEEGKKLLQQQIDRLNARRAEAQERGVELEEFDPSAPFEIRLLERAQWIAMLYAWNGGRVQASIEDVQQALALNKRQLWVLRRLEETTFNVQWVKYLDQTLQLLSGSNAAGLSRSALMRGMRVDSHTLTEVIKELKLDGTIYEMRVVTDGRTKTVYKVPKVSDSNVVIPFPTSPNKLDET